jgi:putative FmdB family regulatory protein
MPLYEYQCEKCGGRFEVIQKFADKPVAVHAGCGGGVHRLISASALKFKGSGFYINDYAKGSSSGGSGAGPHTGKEKSNKENGSGGSDNGKPASESSPAKTASSPTTSTPANSASDTK